MANLITLARTLLAFVVVALLHVQTMPVYLFAVVLTLVLIWMDALDGWVARWRGESSKFGALVDILGDRVVEITYWIVFVSFGWVPLWVAIVIAARGIVVDGLRAVALERGLTAFGMMKSRIGKLLVSSRSSRAAYGIGKALAFSLLILVFTPGLRGVLGEATDLLVIFTYATVYATVALCVVRGLPVLVEAKRLVQSI